MCISLAPARFEGENGTVVIFGIAFHPILRRNVHVLVYQNAPKNLSPGPNAMVLHFPAKPMLPENLIGTENAARIAEDCVEAVRPRRRGGEISRTLLSADQPKVHVFDSGIYTVVLAQNPRDIPTALARVPENKRPAMNTEMFEWYARFRPGWPIALCCFDNKQQAAATPLMWWFDPLDQNMGFLPALDAHDGKPPNIRGDVWVDHWVIFGLHIDGDNLQVPGHAGMAGRLNPVRYQDKLTDLQRALLPTHVIGEQFVGKKPNGDWLMPVQAITDGDVRAITRGILPA